MQHSDVHWSPFDSSGYYYLKPAPPDLHTYNTGYNYIHTNQYLSPPEKTTTPSSVSSSDFGSSDSGFSDRSTPKYSKKMEPLTREEMELFQKLSNEYEPDIEGPLISTKQTTRVIEAEYANADPTLAAKTRALAVTHPTVRLIKGDGNCAWRAISFGYFESLFRCRSVDLLKREYGRVRDMGNMLGDLGYQEYLYETFVDTTLNILAEIVQAIQRGEPDESFLLEALKAPFASDSVVALFRLLTSCYMQANQERFQAVLDVPLIEYCRTRIEPTNPEIDEIGLQALLDGVIDGAGFAVEVLYLDRSEGSEVTPHLLLSSRPLFRTIRLLYRPGHYDLIYQPQDDESVHPLILLQYGMSIYYPWNQPALTFDASANLMGIPQLMGEEANLDQGNAMYSQRRNSAMATSEYAQMSVISPTTATSSSSSPPPQPMAPPPPPMRSNSMPPRPSGGAQIRLNPLVMKQNLNHTPVTTPFRNSPYNQAHFMNDHFEPIHWEPNEYKK